MRPMYHRLKTILLSSTFLDTFYSLAGNAGVALGGMLFTIILARNLSPEQFGIYSSLWALSVLASSLGDMGLSSALVNFIPKLPDSRASYVGLTLYLQLGVALTLFFVLTAFSPYADQIIPGSTPYLQFLAAAMTFIYILDNFGLSLLKAEKKFFLSSVIQTLESGNKLLWLFLAALLGLVSIPLAIIVAVFSAIITTIICLKNEFPTLRWFWPKAQLLEIFTFTKWIALMRVFSVAVARIDILILGKMAGSYEAGIFAAGSRLAILFTLVVSSLSSVVAPRFSTHTSRSQLISYIKKTSVLISIIAAGMLLSALLARPIILLVFGPKYLEAVPVFVALTFAMIPFLLSIITVNPLIYAFNSPAFVAWVTVVQVIALVGLDIYLIPHFGALGPTISLGITNTLVLVLTAIKLVQQIRNDKD